MGLVEAFSAPMANRHLSADEKAKILTVWREQQQTGAAGHGDPDPDMIPWCEKLNALPGVCTVQSCSGHRENGYLRSGHQPPFRLTKTLTGLSVDRGRHAPMMPIAIATNTPCFVVL